MGGERLLGESIIPGQSINTCALSANTWIWNTSSAEGPWSECVLGREYP